MTLATIEEAYEEIVKDGRKIELFIEPCGREAEFAYRAKPYLDRECKLLLPDIDPLSCEITKSNQANSIQEWKDYIEKKFTSLNVSLPSGPIKGHLSYIYRSLRNQGIKLEDKKTVLFLDTYNQHNLFTPVYRKWKWNEEDKKIRGIERVEKGFVSLTKAKGGLPSSVFLFLNESHRAPDSTQKTANLLFGNAELIATIPYTGRMHIRHSRLLKLYIKK